MTEVVVSSCEGFTHEAWAGKHTFSVDEPESMGGKDTGPSPYELILTALGSCTSMTMLMYARRKKWPLERVEIRLRHNRVHADDCSKPSSDECLLDHVEKDIVVAGELSDEQVERLGEIAEMCPVNKTLKRAIQTSQSIRLAP